MSLEQTKHMCNVSEHDNNLRRNRWAKIKIQFRQQKIYCLQINPSAMRKQ